jgi:hypothetical protein
VNRTLATIVDRIRNRVRSNPGDMVEVDAGTLLQIEILQSGQEFSEADVIQAAQQIGVPEGELLAWLEEMASWV